MLRRTGGHLAEDAFRLGHANKLGEEADAAHPLAKFGQVHDLPDRTQRRADEPEQRAAFAEGRVRTWLASWIASKVSP